MKEFLDHWMPPNYSAHGGQLDDLSLYVHWLMAILFVGWGLLFVFMLMRFRRSKHPTAVYHGTKSHVSKYAEIGVFVIECVLLFGISIPAWSRWTTRPKAAANPLEVRVVGEQFAWNVHYPGPDKIFGKTSVEHVTSSNPLGIDPTDPHAKDDIATLNQLNMELNRDVVVRLSAKDVIHSFFLPNMRVKQDAIPGMEVPVHFRPLKTTGNETWEIACAQLCGLGHYRMKGQYRVDTKADFDKWMAQQTPVVASISQ
ncbi:MAG TPA: cytochrome c oxidase subunit II [Thermoanaerobaculia bacterium]|nr:cytochrome c oxidase subunit II [Thermoanaerobaculia bacterium]